MNDGSGPFALVRNWISLIGILLASFGFVFGITLIAIDMRGHFSSPYVGMFTYLVLPVFLVAGLLLVAIGVHRARKRRLKSAGAQQTLPIVDLNQPRQFVAFNVVIVVTLAFLALSAVGSYRLYHFSESVQFCGETCHSVMKPEYTAYQHSPHANAGCTTCHIGPGADFFVKSKLNGLYQVYSVMFNKYSRPIPAPVHNLRPAEETCYTCHWPAKFFGAVEVDRTYFRADEANTPWSIRMLVKVGGGDAANGRAQGIHWHMSSQSKVEYIAKDEKRLDIPWVRVTDNATGAQVVYQTRADDDRLSPEHIAQADIRTMDCIDCHNRPTHQFHSPERALNESLAAGRMDPTLPFIKANGVKALTGEYATEAEALAGIQSALQAEYPDGGPRVETAIAEVQNIYSKNFFPEMKVDWRAYPDHIGHQNSPGCFRCHDGNLVSDNGKVVTRDCTACHTIIAQGPGAELESITSGGLEFEHPEDIDDDWKTTRCSDCHEGVPIL